VPAQGSRIEKPIKSYNGLILIITIVRIGLFTALILISLSRDRLVLLLLLGPIFLEDVLGTSRGECRMDTKIEDKSGERSSRRRKGDKSRAE